MSQDPESIITQARNIWKDITQSHSEEESHTKLYDETSLDLLSQNSNTVIAILSIKDYRKLYVSKNVREIWGYTAEDDSSVGILQYIRMVSFDHAFFPITAGIFYIKCLKEASFEDKINQKIVFIGVKFKTRSGRTARTFVHTSHLEEDDERNPINIINSVQDISHLMKDDFWWMRFSYGAYPQKVKHYHSSIGKTVEGDILSDREKDILRLIHQGLDSPEIADKLFLSTATVHTHRRNMLARTGMKDATALLQIALSIGMI
jgi:DNA-binding CsgD family transcriptional regulator